MCRVKEGQIRIMVQNSTGPIFCLFGMRMIKTFVNERSSFKGCHKLMKIDVSQHTHHILYYFFLKKI